MGTEQTKVCKECSTEKSLDEYYVRKDRNNEPHATCKDCARTRNDKNKQKTLFPEKIAQLEKHRQQKANLEKGLKECLTCKELKLVEDYMTRTGKILYAHCSICRQLRDKEYFANNPDKQIRRHETVLRNRDLVAAYTLPLKEAGCADCKEYYPDAMEFDHTCSPSEKFADIAAIYTVKGSSKSIEDMMKILEAELAKGEYVCVNCHKIRTMQRANSSRVKYLDNPDNSSLTLTAKHVYGILIKESCVDCEENNFLVLEFDHVRGSKTASISQIIRKPRTFPIDVVKTEISKCEIRCGNCHRMRTAARQVGREITEQTPKDSSLNECECGNKKTLNALWCVGCYLKEINNQTNTRYGELETLILRLGTSNFTRVAKELEVSDNAIRKHLRRNGIDPKTLLPVQASDNNENS